MTTTTQPQNVPVLVVGAGPAGLTTAIGLARHGVSSMIVERHPGTSIFPKASGISTRTMEIFRSWGLEEALREDGQDVQPLMSIRPTLTGPQLAVVQLGFPTDEQALAVSPTRMALIPQDRLEPVLLDHARELGVEVRFGTELVSLEQDSSGVTAVVCSVADGTCSTVRAAYVVGADGTRSTVRDLLGIEAHGPSDLGDYATILFRADLWSLLGEERFGLYQLDGPVPGVLVPTGSDDRWVLGMQWDPRSESFADYTPERCIELIRAATGVPDLEVEVLARMPIEFVAQAADRVRDGRTFLIGDAAHRMPPFGGRGLNTAVADAFGLSWKLAWVLRGWADPALLDTYAEEREPVGRHNLGLAAQRSQGGTPDGLTEDMGYVYRSAAIDAGDGGRRTRTEPPVPDRGDAGSSAPARNAARARRHDVHARPDRAGPDPHHRSGRRRLAGRGDERSRPGRRSRSAHTWSARTSTAPTACSASGSGSVPTAPCWSGRTVTSRGAARQARSWITWPSFGRPSPSPPAAVHRRKVPWRCRRRSRNLGRPKAAARE